MSKIIIKLKGGLGNQLFQYAAGRALAIKKNAELFLDLSFLNAPENGYTKRQFQLDQFNLSYQVADQQVLGKFQKKGLLSFFTSTSGKTYGEADFAQLSSTQKDALLDGYWQSEKY